MMQQRVIVVLVVEEITTIKIIMYIHSSRSFLYLIMKITTRPMATKIAGYPTHTHTHTHTRTEDH